MARLFAILKALALATRRDLGTFRSLKTNNFFLFILLMMYGAGESHIAPASSYPLLLFVFLVLLFPLSSDPLDRVPPSRLAMWPLTSSQRFILRMTSLALSPVLWLAVGLMSIRHMAPEFAPAFLTAAILVQVIATLGRSMIARLPPINLPRYVPPIPGRLGGLIRNNLRQMICVLDLYVALILTVGGTVYRWLALNPDPAAFPVLSMFVAMTISTYAQCLFGLDLASSATTRYRLLPLRGWEILLAKDLAFLAVLFVLVLPLDPLPGLAVGLVALAVGHHVSVFRNVRIERWRFSGGRVFAGVVQGVGGFMLGFAVYQRGVRYLGLGVVAWIISLLIYGWQWDRQLRSPHSQAGL